MANVTLINSVTRNTEYPIVISVNAKYNCGTLTLGIDEEWSYQMLMELPSINFKIYKSDGSLYQAFSVNMDTFNSNTGGNVISKTSYSIPIYDIPTTSVFHITPMFDKDAISSHNNLIETGIETGELWTTETQTFNLTAKFDNDSIVSGGASSGGGGGGGDSATDVSFDNTGTGLSATNVQDALLELLSMTNTVSIINYTIRADSWNEDLYTISNSGIKTNSSLYISVPEDITQEQYDALASANLTSSDQTNGSLILRALGDIPTIDIPIILTIENSGVSNGTNTGNSGSSSSGNSNSGSTSADDISFDNTGTGLTATTVQDAIVELLAMTNTVTTVNMTLTASNWSSNNYTITNTNIKIRSAIYISVPDDITEEQYNALASANIVATSQTNGSVTLSAFGDVPNIDIPIIVTIQNPNG